MALAISSFIVFEDIKRERIPNKLLLLLLLLGIAYHALNASNLFTVFFLTLYAVAVAFTLWFLGFWPAGDAKLFSVLFLFFPKTFYNSQVLVFDFMVNAFVPIFFFMFFIIVGKSRFSAIKDALKYTFEPYKVTMLSMILLGFVWFVSKAIQLLAQLLAFRGFTFDYFLSIALLFVVYEIFRRVLSAKLELFFFACAILRVIIDYHAIYSLSFIQHFATVILVFLFFRFFIIHLAFKLYTKSVPIEELEAGMVPGEIIVQKGDGFERISILDAGLISLIEQHKRNAIHSLDFLSEDDVEKIKKLRSEKKIPFDEMLINKVQPFAIFIVLGYALTALAGTNFLNALISLIK